MKTIFITGAHGFIGRHLAKYCHEQLHATVIGLGHGTFSDSQFAQWGMHSSLNGDVRFSNLDRLATEVGIPDIIFHLAGGNAVAPSLRVPEEDFTRTVSSTCELLDWVRVNASSASVVLASSAAVYGTGHQGPIRESASIVPFSPYGYHKRMAELLCESYSKSFGLKTSVVRLFSVYGPELRKQLLWDTCQRLAQDSQPLVMNGTGLEKRDWLHIADCVSFLGRIASLDLEHGIINCGTGIATSVYEIVSELGALWDNRQPPLFSGQCRAGDPQDLIADTSRAVALGWKPKMAWQEGLADYVRWFQQSVAHP